MKQSDIAAAHIANERLTDFEANLQHMRAHSEDTVIVDPLLPGSGDRPGILALTVPKYLWVNLLNGGIAELQATLRSLGVDVNGVDMPPPDEPPRGIHQPPEYTGPT